MTALEQQLGEYLAVRRALGYKLARAGKLLAQFLLWLQERGQDTITTDLALQWATLPPATDSNWHAQRLSVIRAFAAHLHALDPAHEVPPGDLLPSRPRRAVPYLYADSEVLALMDAASIIPTAHRAATLRWLIGLLAVTGMRIGEAIRLDRGDIDHEHELLIVPTASSASPASWRCIRALCASCVATCAAATAPSPPSRRRRCSRRPPARG